MRLNTFNSLSSKYFFHQKTLSIVAFVLLVQFAYSQSCADGSTFNLNENAFPLTCVTSNGAEGTPTTATFDHDFADATGGTYSSGTDGINDVTVTLTTMCSFPNGTNGTTVVGACLGPTGINSSQSSPQLDTDVSGGSDFAGATVNDNPCANCWVVLEYTFINGFTSTADGFNLDWSSMNGSTEGLEAWGGWVEGTTFAAPPVNVADLSTYCNAQAGAGVRMMEHITGTAAGGALPPGVFGADAITGATACPTEEPPSTSGPNSTVSTGLASGAIPANWGLTAGDVINKVSMIYLMSNSNGPDCDGNGTTLVNTSPSGSLSTVGFCAQAVSCEVTIDAISFSDETCDGEDDGTITITATGANLTGALQYSIDGGASFQPTGTFTALPDGTYNIVVEDDMDGDCEAVDVVVIAQGTVLDPPTSMSVSIECEDPAPTLLAECPTPCVLEACAFDPATMEISISFTGDHTFLSDLAFYIQGPTGCTSPILTLAPYANDPSVGLGNCNAGDDFNNVVFTNGTGADFNICGLAAPLTGTFNTAYGVPINWAALAGCDIFESGWQVIVGDCVGLDVGDLDNVVMTVTDNGGGASCLGAGGSVLYDSGSTDLNATLNDNECVPGVDNPASFLINVTPPMNVISWYNAPTGGTPIATGDMLPVAGTTAEEGAFDNATAGDYTYYVDCTCNPCTSERTEVVVTVEACCPDFTTILASDLELNVTESTCDVFGGMPSGGLLEAPTVGCPAGSIIEYSLNGGPFSTTIPLYDDLTAVSVNVRCVCESDMTLFSDPVETVTVPGICPTCPDLTNAIVPQANIASESICVTVGGSVQLDGGQLNDPVDDCNGSGVNTCPLGSTLEYSTDAGVTWQSTLPDYKQTEVVNISTRCVCDSDNTVFALGCTVSTMPGSCPEPIPNVCDCTDLDNPFTINTVAIGGPGMDYTLVYVLVDNDNSDAVLQTNNTGMFTAVPDNTNYSVYAFNVQNADVPAFSAALPTTISMGDPILTMMAPFDAFCYEQSVTTYNDDCQCDSPLISINKNDNDDSDDSQMPGFDGSATFSIEICNEATEPLCDITVSESVSVPGIDVTDCELTPAAILALVQATGNMDMQLDRNECISFTCSVPNVNENFVNRMSVSAVGCDSDIQVQDSDDSDVFVGCPDLTDVFPPQALIKTESICVDIGGGNFDLGGGEISAPTMGCGGTGSATCPPGSSLEYSTDNGWTWQSDVPTYDNSAQMTIITRCVCDADPMITSETCAVTTMPGTCLDPVANECDCSLGETPYTINTIFDNGNQAGYTLIYSLVNLTDGTTFALPDGSQPAYGTAASFSGLPDNQEYQVCAFNVLGTDAVAFQAALTSFASHQEAETMTGAFAGLCYEVNCTTYNEDCDCCIVNAGDQSTSQCDSFCADDPAAMLTVDVSFGNPIDPADGPLPGTIYLFGITDSDDNLLFFLNAPNYNVTAPADFSESFNVSGFEPGDYCIHGLNIDISDMDALTNLSGSNNVNNISDLAMLLEENDGSETTIGEICGDLNLINCTPFTILEEITFDAVAVCRDLTEINDTGDLAGTDYFIEVTNVSGGTGNYNINVGGFTTPIVGSIYGPFTHSGTATGVTTVTVTDNNANNADCINCEATQDVIETICAETVCDCTEEPNGGAILAQSSDYNAVDHCMVYSITKPDGTIEVNATGFYDDLPDGDYTVCAFNVANTDKAAFTAALTDVAAVEAAASLDAAFDAFCYEPACYSETVTCFPDPTIEDVKLECSAIGGTVSLSTLFTSSTTPGGTFTLAGTTVTGATINGGTLSYSEAGCFEIIYSVSADCPVMDNAFICIPEQPTPSFDLSEEVCWDGIAGSLVLPILYNGQTNTTIGTVTYAWTVMASSGGPVPTLTNPSDQEPTVTIQGAGQFEICLSETTTSGPCGTLTPASCTAETCQLLTVTEGNADVVADWDPFGPICSDAGMIDLDDLVMGDVAGVFTGIGVSGTHPEYIFDPAAVDFAGQASVDVTICYTVGGNTDCTAVECHDIRVFAPVDATLEDLVFECTIAPSGNLSLSSLFTDDTTPGGVFSGTGVVGNTLQYDGAG
jgi:hypothetical protein